MAEEISPLENHGWWMEQLRKDAKANRPEALRLADALTKYLGGNTATQAAAELRRLHAVEQELTENLEKKSVAIQRIWKERDELRKLNGELLDALKALCESHSRFSGGVWDKARAVIARAEGQA
jgi:hypothetical protein